MSIQISDNLHEINTPFEDDPLETLKSFVITDGADSLIVDTAYHSESCRDYFLGELSSMGINLKHSKVVLTHLHSDHSGLAADLAKLGAEIFFGEREARYFERINSEEYVRFIELKYQRYGLHSDSITVDDYPERKYRTLNNFPYKITNEGEHFNAGGYDLEIVDLPGHTPGHIGLIDRNHGILFGGDHILEKITPNVDYWDSEFKVVSEYRKSLRASAELNPSLLLTSHGNNLEDCRPAVEKILARQDQRIEEILRLVENGYDTVQSVASHMGWVNKFNGWENFPDIHKWMAVNQVMAYLKYMTEENILQKHTAGGIYHFSTT